MSTMQPKLMVRAVTVLSSDLKAVRSLRKSNRRGKSRLLRCSRSRCSKPNLNA